MEISFLKSWHKSWDQRTFGINRFLVVSIVVVIVVVVMKRWDIGLDWYSINFFFVGRGGI